MESFADSDLIAALATPYGSGALAIIRLSGAGCHERLHQCLTLQQSPTAPIKPRTLYLSTLRDQDERVIDEPLVCYFFAPKSYTGEESAELHLHGGPFIVRKTMQRLLQLGFRSAGPGEFSRRAFLHGKIDLTTAEGIRALASAETEAQWVAARQLARGTLAHAIEGFRDQLIHAMALLEAQIDFPDEGDTSALQIEDAARQVRELLQKVSALSSTFESGRMASEGLRVALIGKPNVGKSTLLNTLLGEERAIVTEIAGTTRDYLEERYLLDGRLIRLVDTAGLRSTTDVIEQVGIERSKAQAEKADLVLFLVAADEDEGELPDPVDAGRFQRVITKSDRAKPTWRRASDLMISAVSGEGLSELKAKLVSTFDERVGEMKEDQVMITAARHFECLEGAKLALERFLRGVESKAFEEMLAFELQEASRLIASITGDISSEDILDRVFSTFCIGK